MTDHIDRAIALCDEAIQQANALLPAQRYAPTLPLPARGYANTETGLAEHRRANLKAHRPMFQRVGGLHWVRLGRLTLQWSWKAK